MPTNKTEFRVKKVSVAYKHCGVCSGTGKKEIKAGGIFKTVNCSHCINGAAKIEHHTEVTLIEALTELGIRFILPESMNTNK